MKKFLLPILFLSWLGAHVFFLNADPDTRVDVNTRGAWTDEGLYAAQVRNFVDTGHFDLHENTTFVRGPLLGILQLPLFLFFGTHLWTARLLSLLALTAAFTLFFRKNTDVSTFMVFFLLTTLSQFHVFHFSHYALGEMVAVSFVLMALRALWKWHNSYFNEQEKEGSAVPVKHHARTLFWAGFFIFLAYGIKIQFLYLAVLPTAVILVFTTPGLLRGKEKLWPGLKPVLASFAFMILFLVIYGIWYAVNKSFYDYIMLNETTGRFPPDWASRLKAMQYTVTHYLWTPELRLTLLLSFLSIAWFTVRPGRKDPFILPFVFGFLWMILELHKLPMMYIPNRYLLPLFVAMGIVLSAGLSGLYKETGWVRSLAWCFALPLFLVNTSFLSSSFQQRTYEIRSINRYVATAGLNGEFVLGSWAPTATWESKARAVPVWGNYINDKNPLDSFRPRLVLSEYNQAESDKAWENASVNLIAESDSMRSFRLWRYDVIGYWMSRGE